MAEVITLVIGFLGLCYTVINSFYTWEAVGLKMKGFVSIENKVKLSLSNVIIFLIFLICIAYSIDASNKVNNIWVQVFMIFMAILFGLMFLISIVVMITKNIRESCDVYYILSGKIYILKHIENDILLLESLSPNKKILLKNKAFLFKNKHLLLNGKDYNKFRKEKPFLFID